MDRLGGGGHPGEFVPRIGEGVLLGAGCVLLGDIEIGDGVVIGANAVVTKSVPPNAVVAGVPAKVIKFVNDSAQCSVNKDLNSYV